VCGDGDGLQLGSDRTKVIELLGDPKQVVGQTPDHVERVLDCPLGQPQQLCDRHVDGFLNVVRN
jgi:hypothetical protein